MPIVTYVAKQPSEEIPVAVSFVNRLPTGETLQGTSSVDAVAVSDGSDASSLVSDLGISSPIISCKFTGGVHGEDYKLTFLAATQNYTYEWDVVVQVRGL
jgi:hypothetical protein